MALSTTEVEQFTKDRVAESRREKAEIFQARRNAEESNAWNQFLEQHSGQFGIAHGTYWACDANNGLMEEWVRSHYDDKEITIYSLNSAFTTLRAQDRLATLPAEKYQRQTNTQESRVFKQRHVPAPPLLVLPWTKEEIISWPKNRLKKEMRSPAHTDALNRILAGN